MFSTQEYWNEQYKDGKLPADEWHLPYEQLKPIYQPSLMVPRSSILFIGPGFSTFPEEIYDVGPKAVFCLEVSPAVCDYFNARNSQLRHGLEYKVGSIADGLHYEPNSFTLVFDKGTIDCLLCGGVDGYAQAERAIRHTYELMRTPATLIYVSHSPPVDRIDLINTCYWHEVKVKRVQRVTMMDVVAKVEEHELEDIELTESHDYDPRFLYVYVLLK